MIHKTEHIAAIILLGLYLLFMGPHFFWNDSGLLIAGADSMGVIHPSGHPLFTILCKISTLIPLGNISFRANLSSAVFCILSFYLFLSVARMSLRIIALDHQKNLHIYRFLTLLLAFSFMLSGVTLAQAVSVETYSLELFLALIVFFFVLKIEICATDDDKSIYFAVAALFVLGLAFGNHTLLTMSFFIPFLGYCLIRFYSKLNPKFCTISLLFMLIGVSVYIYLPLRAHASPLINTADPQTFDNFLWLVRGGQYRENIYSLSTALGNLNLEGISLILSATWQVVTDYLSYFWFGLFLVGLVLYVRKKNLPFIVFLLTAVFSLLVTAFWTLTNKVSLEEAGDIGYYLVPISIFFLIAGLGLSRFAIIVYNYVAKRWIIMLLVVLSGLAPFLPGIGRYDLSKDYTAGIFGRAVFNSIDYKGLYFSVSDPGNFLPSCLQVVEKARQDVDIINSAEFFSSGAIQKVVSKHSDLFSGFNFSPKAFKSYGEFRKIVGAQAGSRKIYWETGRDFMSVQEDFYPNVFVYGLGRQTQKAIKNHFISLEKNLKYIKHSETIRKDSLRVFSNAINNIGIHFLERKEWEIANRQYSLAYALNPYNEKSALNYLGSYLALKKYRDAVELGDVVNERFTNPDISYNFILALMAIGEREKAMIILKESKERYPESSMFKGAF